MGHYTGAIFFRVVGDARAEYRLVNETTQARQFAALVARVSIARYDYLFVMRHDVRVSVRCTRGVWRRPARGRPAAQSDHGAPRQRPLHGRPRALYDRLFFKLLFHTTRCWSLDSKAWAAQTGHFWGQVFRDAAIPYRTCNATRRVRHHSPNYTTHALPECKTLAAPATVAWRCGR